MIVHRISYVSLKKRETHEFNFNIILCNIGLYNKMIQGVLKNEFFASICIEKVSPAHF